MNNDIPKGMCRLCSLHGPTEPRGLPWEQQERHREGITVEWSVVVAALPARTSTSPSGFESRAVRPLHGPGVGTEQEGTGTGAVPGEAGGGARLGEENKENTDRRCFMRSWLGLLFPAPSQSPSRRMEPVMSLKLNSCPCRARGRRDGDPILATLQAMGWGGRAPKGANYARWKSHPK